ncbi:MAG: hypothetical protein LUE64_06910, partial [Candidatus Gastranaerophilales bacterium]|nr:hypothetical protein [Candidatus Gastranaerophilales bacterium]
MDKRAKIQGFSVDLLSFDEVIQKSFSAAENGQNLHIVTINPEIILSANKNNKLAEIIKEAEIITPDGIGIKIALKLKGITQERVTGVDLSKEILK